MMSNPDQIRQEAHRRKTAAGAAIRSTFVESRPVFTEERHVALLLSDAEGLVYYADAQCCKLTGELIRGTLWTQVVAQEDRGWVDAAWAEDLNSRLPFCTEFRIQSARGRRWVRACGVYGADMFDDGMLGWTWHLTDCTLEHRLSEAAVLAL